MYRSVGAVRHNSKLSWTHIYKSSFNGCNNGSGIYLFYFSIFHCNIIWYILIPAIELTPGGSSTVHIYTHIINRTYITIKIPKYNLKNTLYT
jgi:hypothetical protein